MTTDTHQPLTDKYAPQSLDEVQGHPTAIDGLKQWANDFPTDPTPRLLYGPPGTGKTTTVHRLAEYLDWPLVEVNTSDAREKDDVAYAARLCRGRSADGTRQVVLLDEVDSWHHSTNLRPLYDALEAPTNLVVLTSNDEYETPDGFTTRCETIKFDLTSRSIKARLKKIRDREDLALSADQIDRLADRPDLRTAINDIPMMLVEDDATDDVRAWDDDEWAMLDRVLTGTPDIGDMTAAEAIPWLDENVVNDYDGLELAWAYEALARADAAITQHGQRFAEAMVEQVGPLRRSEPYYDDELHYSKKGFPEWFRHSKPKPDGGSPEAALYQALKDGDVFAFSGDYRQFRTQLLPLVREESPEVRCEIALAAGLTPEDDGALDALNLQTSQYREWYEVEAPAEGEWGGTTHRADAW